MAKKIKKTEFVGKGCIIQGIALLCIFLGYFLDYKYNFGSAAVVFWIALIALIIGGRMAFRWICGNCGTKLKSKRAKKCPHCEAELEF